MKKNRLNLVLTLLLTLTMLAMTGCGGATAAAPADEGGSDVAVTEIP